MKNLMSFWFPIFVFASAVSGCHAPEAVSQPDQFLQSPSRRSDLLSVTHTFGPLLVREGWFTAESPLMPWSSWWYPKWDTRLFESSSDGASPLEKYDAYVRRSRGRPSLAAEQERKLYDSHASAWEGLCDAWAMASLMEAEPKGSMVDVDGKKLPWGPVTVDGIQFNVGDLKALLLKTYEGISSKDAPIFGQRNDGRRDIVFDDIYPDQFHRFMQLQLFEHLHPFIMDKDPGMEVWNVPVWKAETRIRKDASDPHLLHVNTWVTYASFLTQYYDANHVLRTQYDYVGTLWASKHYTYDLYGTLQADGRYRIEYGEWTGESLEDHPDFVVLLPEKKVRHVVNSEIDPAIVDEILAKAHQATLRF